PPRRRRPRARPRPARPRPSAPPARRPRRRRRPGRPPAGRSNRNARPPPRRGRAPPPRNLVPRKPQDHAMAVKIEKKITGYSVVTPEDREKAAAGAPVKSEPAGDERPSADVIQMHERIERPDVLVGSTYKIKSPLVEHAMYVTINDIVLNAGTEHEHRRPFEIFINSKSMEHFQWIVALTRIMSAVFRKGGDVTFLVEEWKAVFEPTGGYFKAGGVYMPSLVAELGFIVEEHLKSIGLLHDPQMSAAQKALIAEKRKQYEARSKKNPDVAAAPSPAP